MTRLEFDKVMEATDIEDNVLISEEGDKVHYWEDFAISFSGTFYAIVKGKIPLEVANIIWKKYPDNPYNIRVEGARKDLIPTEYAIDEIYNQEKATLASQELNTWDYLEKCKKAFEECKKRNDDNKYLTTYHIDTKEGLLIFLTEMKDYYLRKQNMPETEVQRYEELLAIVTFRMLEKVKPNISIDKWMQAAEINRDFYNSSVERENKDEIWKQLRMAISDFDKAVNPFLNDIIGFDKMSNCLKRISISANSYNRKDNKYREGCCSLEITDLSTDNKTIYDREPDGFLLKLIYKFDEEKTLEVLHYFSNDDKDMQTNNGEVVAIHYTGNPSIRLNVTNGTINKDDENQIPATPDQIDFVYRELLKAITYAEYITIDNMTKDVSSEILEGIFLKLHSLGIKSIPISQKSFDECAECFKEIISEYNGINMGDTFNIMPVLEIYNTFQYYVRTRALRSAKPAYFYQDKLVFGFPDFYVQKRLGELIPYEELIARCAKTYAEKYLGYVDFSDSIDQDKKPYVRSMLPPIS